MMLQISPWILAANVRGEVTPESVCIVPGRARPGDLVLGMLEPPPGTMLTVIDNNRVSHRVTEPTQIMAVVGPRDSSTHVCATVPHDGLVVEHGTCLHWIAGESGIVGQLEAEPGTASLPTTERSAPFQCRGLVADETGVVNICRFAVTPRLPRLEIPVIMIAASSSEAGKTILAGEIIRRLSSRGRRVAAIKATGTGGVLDSMQHARCGAAVTLDQVDAGLITTHGPADEVRTRIPLAFRHAQELGVELIVAELGGDLISANNPTLFELSEIMAQTVRLLVITNDALAARGVVAVNDDWLHFSGDRIRFLTSPFRNHAGICRRLAAVGISAPYDPCSATDLDRLVDEILDELDKCTDSTSHVNRERIA